ncbi:MAG: ATP-binding cassette domain-containing protein [Magnetococcales bacterium]|nr:ATP-binding cassette domain-containing protein [Magnetococcales bacterium]
MTDTATMEKSSTVFNPVSDIAKCLAPLLDAIGWRGNRMQLMEALPYMPDAMDFADLLNVLASLKFSSRVERLALKDLDPRLLPCLFVPDKEAAMVVLKNSNDGDWLVYHGGIGEFQQISDSNLTGRVVFFIPISKGGLSPLNQQDRWFRRSLDRFTGILVWGGLISFFLSIVAMVAPIFTMTIYDQVLGGRDKFSLYLFIVGGVLFFLMEFGFRLLRAWLFSFISVRLNYIVGTEILRRILYLPPSYTESASVGAQMSRVRDFESVRDFFSGQGWIALMELPFTLLLFLALIYVAGPLSYIPLGGGVFLLVFGWLIYPWLEFSNKEAAEQTSGKRQFLLEMLTNFRAIKYTGTSEYWRKRHEILSSEAAFSVYRSGNMTNLINTISQAVVTLAGVMTVSFGVFAVLANTLTIGSLMASMMLTWRILTPMRTGFGVITQLGKIKKSIAQLDRLMNLKMEKTQEASMQFAKEFEGTVEFSQVSMRYNSEAHPALLGVSFQLKAGQTLLVVGHDGAGKSTLLKLLLGLHQPQSGRILIDGLNVRQIDPILLRRSLAYAPQKNNLFYGTLAQNLRFTDPAATLEELQKAVQRVGLWEEIQAMPQLLETRIGDHNIAQLSTSFQRRFILARTLLRQGKILLLDEPERGLSEVDLEKLRTELLAMKGDRTVIVASNAPDFWELADVVMWLENNRVRALGAKNNNKVKGNSIRAIQP